MTKFIFPLLITLIFVPSILLSGDFKKPVLVLFVLSLQFNLNTYLGSSWHDSPTYVGVSGADGFFFPFLALPGLLLLIHDRFTKSDNMTAPFSWGERAITLPFVWLVLTAAMTIFYAPETLRVIYYVQYFFHMYLVFLVVTNCIKSREELTLVVTVLMASLAIQSAVYFIQYITGVGFTLNGEVVLKANVRWTVARYGGTIASSPAAFGSFILPLLMIAMSRFLTAKDHVARHAILPALGIFALVLTFTRAIWIGFGIGMIWLVTLGVKRGIISKGRLVPVLVVALMAIVALFPLIMIRLSDNSSAALDTRVGLMRMAWHVIKAQPVLGVGAGSYPFVFRDYLTPELEHNWLHVVHNVYLLRWAETGIFGLLALLAFWFVGLRQAIRCSRLEDEIVAPLAVGWSAGLAALLWEQWWDMTLGLQTDALVWFMFGLLLVAKRLVAATSDQIVREIPLNPAWQLQ